MAASAGRADVWEHFPHGADMGVRGIGLTLEGAFEQAALSMIAVMVDLDRVSPNIEVGIDCEAPNEELLLVDWLNALVYEMAVRHMLFGRFRVRIQDDRLFGRAWGEPIDPEKHPIAVEIKGATYTALRVACGSDGFWRAQCVVDV